MKRLFKICFLVVCIFVCSTVLVGATKKQIDEAKEQKKEIENSIKQTQQKIANLQNLSSEAKSDIKALSEEISSLEESIISTANEISQLEVDMAEAKTQLAEIKEKARYQYELAAQRIRYMYEAGSLQMVDVVAGEGSLNDVFNNVEYSQQIAAYDRELMKNISVIKEEVANKEAELDSKHEIMALRNEELGVQKKAVETAKQIKANKLNEYATSLKNSTTALEQLEKEEKEQEALIKKLELMSKLTYDGGNMLWPLKGRTYISSKFGMRLHPIYKIKKMHNGIDLPAPAGTNIYAAYKGKVVISGYSSSYGNYIMIDHGSGYYTIYAHCTKLLAKEGVMVETGQRIALVGSTGNSTGNHLHFGIRKNGVYVNPVPYLVKWW